MKKRILFLILGSIVFLGVFEFYLFYLVPQELSAASFFMGIFASIFSPESNKAISINLYNKSLTLYENGVLTKQAKISAYGHPKAAPTPTGNFKISYKDIDHISGISGLVMPFSLRFFNSYYLHGLPTTRAGVIINTPYSNGCIRLGAGLDEEIFNWADIGTRVQIYNASLVKTDQDPTVYFLTADGWRQPIASPQAFEAQGWHWKEIAVVPEAEILSYPEGTIIK